MSRPSPSLTAEIRRRASGRCEYCHFPEAHAVLPFEVEHIVPIKHDGLTNAENLALACFYCNRYKGPNVAGMVNGLVTRLFHPRTDSWNDHFYWDGGEILPRSEIGQATISVLRMNQPSAVAVRQVLIAEQLW